MLTNFNIIWQCWSSAAEKICHQMLISFL